MSGEMSDASLPRRKHDAPSLASSTGPLLKLAKLPGSTGLRMAGHRTGRGGLTDALWQLFMRTSGHVARDNPRSMKISVWGKAFCDDYSQHLPVVGPAPAFC